MSLSSFGGEAPEVRLGGVGGLGLGAVEPKGVDDFVVATVEVGQLIKDVLPSGAVAALANLVEVFALLHPLPNLTEDGIGSEVSDEVAFPGVAAQEPVANAAVPLGGFGGCAHGLFLCFLKGTVPSLRFVAWRNRRLVIHLYFQ